MRRIDSPPKVSHCVTYTHCIIHTLSIDLSTLPAEEGQLDINVKQYVTLCVSVL